MSVMFANTRANQSSSGHLVEFKAGRSNLQAGSTPETRKVVADKTKGLVFIKQSNDQLIHFCWKNRESGAVVDDLIIFPGDTEFVHVKECQDGRVYMLKFKSTDERRLFWMQDGKVDKDEEYCKKVNETLNNPPTARTATHGNADRPAAASYGNLAALSGLGLDGELGALGNLDQSQLMQLLTLMSQSGANSASDSSDVLPQLPFIANSSRTPATANSSGGTTQVGTPSNTPANGAVGGTSSSNAIQLSQLKDIIAQIHPDTKRKILPIDLSDILCGIQALDVFKQNGDRLLPHLPDQMPALTPQEELEMTPLTPQFRQAVGIFGQALQSGQLAPVFQQFGLPEAVITAARTDDIRKFAAALTAAEGGTDNDEKTTQNPSSSSSMPKPQNPEIDAQIAKEAEAEETNETMVQSGDDKAEKPDADDGMDLD